MTRVGKRKQFSRKRVSSHIFIGTFASALVSFASVAASEENYRCGKGDDIRRIEIRFESEDGDLPCRVIYRPEFESDTIGTVSWRGIADVEICKAQATEVVDRLTGEGWVCSKESGPSEPQGEFVQTADLGGLANQAPGEQRQTPDQPIEGGFETDEVGSAELLDNPDLAAPSADLVALINADLGRLDATVDGKLEGQIANYGDLNADDIEDALVLFSYTSPQPAHRQFLAAYLFDGESYQLAATKPVGGSAYATMQAKVEQVDQGVVHLSLAAFEPGDPSCCPSGTRELALVLRNLDLVQVDSNAPTR
ncbi:MAG: hypothetical protein ACR2Q4_17970 [Geminicoccaceae bacterium]